MNIAEWQDKFYALAKEKGWWDDVSPRNEDIVPEKLALIHSEVSEALEVYRETPDDHALFPAYADPDGERHDAQFRTPSAYSDPPRKPVGFDSELADVVIRVMDLCAHLGIDLERAIREKHAYNETRPRRHGGKRC